ncbi:hypothetical protein GCM10028801_01280 [Nocardioides maradonensis]
MSDPLEQLDRFRSEVEGAPMLTAAEIRRRGDRIRRRGTALKAGVAALAVAALVVPLAARADHDDKGSGVANDPTKPVPSALSQANLVKADDVGYMAGMSWTQTYSGAPDVQAPFMVCAAKPLPDLGTTTAVQRDFTAHSDETGEGSDTYLNESIGRFASPDAAASAAATIRDWYTHCSPTGSTSYRTVKAWHDVPTGTSATASQMIATYGPADAVPGSQYDVSNRPDLHWFIDASVIVDGDRVAVLTQTTLVPDYDTTAITPTSDDVAIAAQRLVEGSAPTSPPTTTAGSPGSAPGSGSPAAGHPTTTIPAGFPLDSGWQDDQPEGPDSRLAPSRTRAVPELNACGTTLPWPAYEDRLSAAFHNPEDSRDHVLMTYADADTAVAATKAMVDLFRACPTEPGQPDGYVLHTQVSRTDTSGDSWLISSYYTFHGAPALGLIDIEVVRVGLGVLVITHGNEGGKESIPMDSKGMETEAADSIAAMCAFTEAGC